MVVPAATSKDWPAGMKVTLGIPHAAMLLMRSIASLIIHSGVSLAPLIPTFSFPRSHSSLRSVDLFDLVHVRIEGAGDLDHPGRHSFGPAEDNDRSTCLASFSTSGSRCNESMQAVFLI